MISCKLHLLLGVMTSSVVVTHTTANQLLTVQNSFAPDCGDPFYLSCSQVSVNFEAFVESSKLSLPAFNISLIRKEATKQKKQNKTKIRKDVRDAQKDVATFENKEERAEAIFVYGKDESGQFWISGTLNWAKAGRHFQLSMCKKVKGCFIWSELDSSQWIDDTDRWDLGEASEHLELSGDQLELLELGQVDKETLAVVTVTVHMTDSFRRSFDYSQALIDVWMAQAEAETNEGYSNSKIPIEIKIHCLVESGIPDDVDLHVMMADFKDSSLGDLNNLRRGADIAVLMTDFDADVCGVGKVDSIASGTTLAVLKKKCAVGYYSLGHEIGHMYGCYHNREEGKVNLDYPNAYGFLMRPPVESGLRTILAYTASGYKTRVNYYSGVDVFYDDVPTGDVENDNAATIAKRRFLMANVGKEELSCVA